MEISTIPTNGTPYLAPVDTKASILLASCTSTHRDAVKRQTPPVLVKGKSQLVGMDVDSPPSSSPNR
jgi:hypothetical protein